MSDEKFRLGVWGLSHDHVWDNLPHLLSSPDAELAAIADPHPELLEKVQSEFGCEVYESFEDMADEETLDGVMIYCSNSEGAYLTSWAANLGLHVLIEKPMASTLTEAEMMLAAALNNQTRLMINWPFAWWPQLQHAIQLAGEGAIGDLWQVKYRAAHAGPQELGCSQYFCDWLFDSDLNGAGALMDYCCYGSLLARVLLGLPSRVSGFTGRLCKEQILVEDNALIVMTYPQAMATAEGSWSQIGKLTAYSTVIYGTRGTLLVEPRVGGRLLLANSENPEGIEVAVPEAADHLRNPVAHFLHGIRTGAAFHPLCDPKMGRDTQEILEAGLLSASSGEFASLPLPG